MSVIQEFSVTDSRMSISVSEHEEATELEILFATLPSLVTHVGFIVRNSSVANSKFQLVGVDARWQEQEDFSSLLDTEIQGHDYSLEFSHKGSAVLVPALGLSYALRLTFECEKDPEDFDQEVAAISQRTHWASIMFQETYASISAIGFTLNSNPTASHVVTLLNAAGCLRHVDADYLAGLALMNARRFVQAAEFIRRAQTRLVGNTNIPLQNPRSTHTNRSPSATTNKKLLRAAKLELLVAEGFNQHGQILDKLIAYERATELFLGGAMLEAVGLDSDVYSSLLQLQPFLGRLLLRNLQDKLEPLRIACIRGLEFLLEHLGCSIGTQFTLLLKTVIKSYPAPGNSGTYDSFSNSLLSNTSLNEGTKEEPSPALVDAYNRLLETCLSTLSSCAPQLLHSIFYEVLSHNLQLPELPSDLKNYLIRLTEKITTICEGDLQFSNSLLSGIILARTQEETAEGANRLWELVKNRVLVHYAGNRLAKLIQWMKELLVSENEHENMTVILELIHQISSKDNTYSQLTGPRNKPELALLEPILSNLLDFASSQHDRLDLFTQTWRCLSNVSEQVPNINLLEYALPLLEMTKDYCQDYSPPLNMLKFLELVLSSLQSSAGLCEFLLSFLSVFCGNIPSNVNDEVFSVLNIILRFVGNYLSSNHIVKLIDALLDQYTVKSQSQRQSKDFLVQIILSKSAYFKTVLTYCLLNIPPQPPSIYKYDRQRIMTEHDQFLEKVSFAIEVMSLMDEDTAVLITERLDEIPPTSAILLKSKDSHIRIRGLEVLRLLGEACLLTSSQECLRASNYMLEVVVPVLKDSNDPKLIFFSLQLIDMVFKHLVPSRSRDRQAQETRCIEALKIWTHVQLQIESPWSNIRAIAFSILCACIQVNLNDLRPAIQHKLRNSALPLIMSLLSSKDSESRAGGLNLLGSFCGLSLADERTESFRHSSEQVPLAIWEQVFHLQDDWDGMIRDAAAVLVQLCAPRDAVQHFYLLQREEHALRFASTRTEEIPEPDESLFWIDSYAPDEVLELVSMFKNDSKIPSQLWNEYRDTQEDDLAEDFNASEAKGEEESETLDDLGIIEVDDEILGEEEEYPIIKNSYPKKRMRKRNSPTAEDHTWTRALRPHNASLRPCTPPAKPRHDLPLRPSSKHRSDEPPRPQPPPKVPHFTVDEPAETFHLPIYEADAQEDSKRSPRTPRRRVDDPKMRPLGGSAFSKIYMHKPEVKKKSKSLNNSLIRQRRQSGKMNKTPAKRDL